MLAIDDRLLLLILLDVCDLSHDNLSVGKTMFLHSYDNETLDV